MRWVGFFFFESENLAECLLKQEVVFLQHFKYDLIFNFLNAYAENKALHKYMNINICSTKS